MSPHPDPAVRPTRRPPGGREPLRVSVVGAGISGLAAAARIRAARPDVEVVVLEASDRIGGKLRTAQVAGLTVDVGAESMLARRPEAVELATEHGLSDRLVSPATTAARVWSRGALRPLPRSVMGVPTDLGELAGSGLLSPAGLARARMDAVLPPTDVGEDDLSVGALVEDRLGREVVDRLVEPLLGGVYAGHAREISARAATPQLVALLAADRSLVRAAAAAVGPRPEPGAAAPPVFAGLRGGLGGLADAVAVGLEVLTRVTVRDLLPAGSGGWHLVTGPATAPVLHHADAVVLATPAPATARLLATVAPGAAVDLAEVEHASTAVVTMVFRAADLPAVEGSGFLVPPVEGLAVKASTFSFAKWGWVREASEDLRVLRTSLGRHREERTLQADDAELVERSLRDLGRVAGLRARPVDALVTRWGGGLPQYAVGHLDRVRRVREEVSGLTGLAVCGAAYDGLGIPACVASAEAAAARVLADLDRGPDGVGRPARMGP